METCIEVQNVVKRFRDQVVLKNVSISFEKGKIHGIVGRNGSGKTVLFKCICGLMHPEEGVILVNGKRVGRDVDMPEDIGAIIEAPGFLPNYSGYKNLRFLANIRRKIGKEEILNVLKTVGLDPESRKHVGKYSLGMRQRLGIAQAIMEDPEILILDEPMNGLDNRGVEDMRALCSRVMVLGHGQLLYDGTLTNLLHRYDTAHTLTVTYDGAADASKLPQGAVKDGDTWRIALQKDGDLSRTMQQVMAAGKMHEMAIEEQNVDELIARMYREMAL